jgi:hypothetical protein
VESRRWKGYYFFFKKRGLTFNGLHGVISQKTASTLQRACKFIRRKKYFRSRMCRFGSTTESAIPSDPELHAECVQACQRVLARGVIIDARNITNPSLPSSPWTYSRPEVASAVFRLRTSTGPSERQVDACGTHEVGYCALHFSYWTRRQSIRLFILLHFVQACTVIRQIRNCAQSS